MHAAACSSQGAPAWAAYRVSPMRSTTSAVDPSRLPSERDCTMQARCKEPSNDQMNLYTVKVHKVPAVISSCNKSASIRCLQDKSMFDRQLPAHHVENVIINRSKRTLERH